MNVYEQMIGEINKGWSQEGLEDINGGCCLLGAAKRVLNKKDSYVDDQYTVKIASIIQEQFPDHPAIAGYQKNKNNRSNTNFELCYLFNDNKETTKEDVLLVLEKAAADERI